MSAAVARRALALLDLTSLNDGDTAETIDALCQRAITPFGAVAAVCIWRPFVAQARKRLAGTAVRVATVVNFPAGTARWPTVAAEIAASLETGAHEVDAVLPYHAFLAGNVRLARDFVRRARLACGARRTLKIILETGAYGDPIKIFEASQLALAEGADFIKTSTGKIAMGASPVAVEQMLRAIAKVRRRAGLKVSGGVRTVTQAESYLRLAEEIKGAGWPEPRTFRFGASGLLDDILAALGDPADARAASNY